MERVCFLHIGTHKTGTTSLQTLLTSNEQCLERNGILVPKTGRAWNGSGQHNLAWERVGDDRFNASFGTWRDVIGEIQSSNLPIVCISSEDFEYLHREPEALARIRQDLNAIGYRVKIVIYLRPQADYVESLYAEFVKHGLDADFRECLEEMLSSGAILTRKTRKAFAFDYRELIDPFARIFGSDGLVVRPYYANRQTIDLLDDFMSLISGGSRILGLDFGACRERQNQSLIFSRLLELLLANRGENEGAFAPNRANIPDADFMNGSFDPLDLRNLIRIHRHFRKTNRVLRDRYQVNIPTMTSRRLLRELLCSLGINRGSLNRKKLLALLETPGPNFRPER